MKKKLVSMFLVAAMITSLAACGQTDQTTSSGHNSSAASTAEASGTESAATESTVKESTSGEVNLYGFDEPVTMKIGVSYSAAADFAFLGGETVKDNAWMDLYKSNNIIPEIMWEVDPSQAETKLSTAIMSGDYPDVFSGTGAEYSNYIDSGAVADITEIYEKYASDELKAYMAVDGSMALESLYVDGKLYGLPKVNDPYADIDIMWIRQDWLDRLGLAIPTTMEELKEVAHAFTYDDPDGNGKNDTYGLALDGVDVLTNSVGNMEPVFRAYGAYLDDDGLTYLEKSDGTISWGGDNSEGMKQALQLLNDMYTDGSIAKDFVTMNSQSIFAEAGAGRCGIWFGPNWGAMDPAVKATQNDINCHMVAAAIPTGTGEVTKGYAAATPSTVYFLSSKCENPEAYIKLWNLSVKYQNTAYCTADEYNMYYGDSANYTGWKTAIIPGGAPNGRTTNRALITAMESGDASALDAKQIENYNAMKAYVDAVEAGTFDPKDAELQRGLSLYTVHADPQSPWTVIHKMIEQEDYILSAYNGIPSDEVSNGTGTLKKLLVETIVKTITGSISADSFDSFIDTWYAMGGQAAMDEANAAR